MIIRIQGEGQWKLSAAHLDALDKIDDELVDSVSHNDQARFTALLDEMLDHVRRYGQKLQPDEIAESALILPPADATIEEVKSLFTHEGLIVE